MSKNKSNFRPWNMTPIFGSQAKHEAKFVDDQPDGVLLGILPNGKEVRISAEEMEERQSIAIRTEIARLFAGVFRVLLIGFVPVMCLIMIALALWSMTK